MDKISVPGAPSAAVTNAPVNNAADTDAGVSTAQNVLPPSAAVTNAPVSDAAAVTDGGVPQIALTPPPPPEAPLNRARLPRLTLIHPPHFHAALLHLPKHRLGVVENNASM